MPGCASGAAWLGVSVPQLPCELPPPDPALLEHGHAAPSGEEIMRAGQADHAAAEDQYVRPITVHRAIVRSANPETRPATLHPR
jgi:hypothetical protein